VKPEAAATGELHPAATNPSIMSLELVVEMLHDEAVDVPFAEQGTAGF